VPSHSQDWTDTISRVLQRFQVPAPPWQQWALSSSGTMEFKLARTMATGELLSDTVSDQVSLYVTDSVPSITSFSWTIVGLEPQWFYRLRWISEKGGWFLLVMKYAGEIQVMLDLLFRPHAPQKEESTLLLQQWTVLGPCLLYFENWDMGGVKESVSMSEILHIVGVAIGLPV